MTNDAAALSNHGLQTRGRDVLSGVICSVLSIAYGLSYAALIFKGPLASWLSYGMAVTFLSTAIGATIVALRSSFPFAIAGPDSSTAAVMSVLVAAVAEHLTLAGRTDLLGPTLIAMAVATAAAGLLLLVLGFTNAGRAIRYVPYPVIGGFLGATGWLTITGAIRVIADQSLTIVNLRAFDDAAIAAKLAAGLAVAITLQLASRRGSNAFTLPAILLVAIALTHLFLPLAGSSIAAAQASGWLFQPQTAVQLRLPWTFAELHSFPWTAVPALAGDILAVMFVTAVSLLLNTTGIEYATRREANIERELKAVGLANLVTAAFGGYVSCLSLSRTVLAHVTGATGRLCGLTVAAIAAGAMMTDPALLGYMPKYVLGGLLFYLGGGLVYRWLVSSSRQLRVIEYLSLIAITLLIINWGFIAGVLIGVVIGCATFALSASRVNAIKFSFDSSEYRSALDRSEDELTILREHGDKIQGLMLQSYLFFGSANRLYQHVKALLAREPQCQFLIFDFHLVTGIDSSATYSFEQIKRAANDCGARIVLVNLTDELQRAFRTTGFLSDDVIVSPNLDRALESCEQTVVDAHLTEGAERRSLREWLSEVLHSAEYGDELAAFCRRLEFQTGDIIARQGEASNSMHFILEGRLGIVVTVDERRPVRVRSLGRYTTVGELGLVTRRPRTATIQAETAGVLYELSVDDLERIEHQNAALGQALLRYLITMTAARLDFANRVIGVLQR